MSAFVRRNLIYTWLAAISVLLGVIAWGQAAAERKVTELCRDRRPADQRARAGRDVAHDDLQRGTLPGLIFKGKEHPFPNRQAAGILFFNDEGTENGGLLFGGAKKGQNVGSGGHLSFDQYEQDQVISLDQTEDHGRRRAGLAFFDRPSQPLSLELIDKLEHAGRHCRIRDV